MCFANADAVPVRVEVRPRHRVFCGVDGSAIADRDVPDADVAVGGCGWYGCG
jgi:hypothetical protein